jgi:hypothetical protein
VTPERRTDIVLLIVLALTNFSFSAVPNYFRGSGVWVTAVLTVISGAVMFAIYWRFNREGASLLQTFSYWGIVLTFIATQRIGMLVDRSDPLAGLAVRLVTLVPIYIYAVVSRRAE